MEARHIDGRAPANPSEQLEWIEARETIVARGVVEALARENRALRELDAAKRTHTAAKARFVASDAPADWARMSDAEAEQHRLELLHAAASKHLIEARRVAAEELRQAQRARLEEIRPALARDAMLEVCKPFIDAASAMALLAVEARELARATGAEPPPRLDWAALFEAAVATDMIAHAELVRELRTQFVWRSDTQGDDAQRAADARHHHAAAEAFDAVRLAAEGEWRPLVGDERAVTIAAKLGDAARAAVARLPVDASEYDRTTAIQLAVAEATAGLEPAAGTPSSNPPPVGFAREDIEMTTGDRRRA